MATQSKRSSKKKSRRWSRKYVKCVRCGTRKEPHHSKGRCAKCRNLIYKAENTEQISAYFKGWWEKNRERVLKKWRIERDKKRREEAKKKLKTIPERKLRRLSERDRETNRIIRKIERETKED